MKGFSSKLAIAITGLLLAAGPAWAQGTDDRPRPGGGVAERAGGGGGSTTTTGSGGSASNGGSTSTGGSVSSSGDGGGGSVSSSGGFSNPSFPPPPPPADFGDRSTRTSERESRGTNRKTSRPESGERAVPRGTGADRENTTTPRKSETDTSVTGTNDVPDWSRPRGDRPATDVAVPRVGPTPPRDSGDRNRPRPAGSFCTTYFACPDNYPPDWTYPPYYLSSFPMWLGVIYGTPSWDPYPPLQDPRPDQSWQDQGSLKLKVKPRTAKVYVDGYYVGVVDEFDGAFQKLALNVGRHKIAIRAEGFQSIELDVDIFSKHTTTFGAEMIRVQ